MSHDEIMAEIAASRAAFEAQSAAADASFVRLMADLNRMIGKVEAIHAGVLAGQPLDVTIAQINTLAA